MTKAKKCSACPSAMRSIAEALTLGAQPGFIPQKPVFTYGLGLTRYNRIEGLSSGIGVRQSLGGGYTARALARIGTADLTPTGELGLVAHRTGEIRLALVLTAVSRRRMISLIRFPLAAHSRRFCSGATKDSTIAQPASSSRERGTTRPPERGGCSRSIMVT